MRGFRLVPALVRLISALGYNDPPSRMPGRRRRIGGGGRCPREGCDGSLRRNNDGGYTCLKCGHRAGGAGR
jgi:hypothetical protein